MADKTTISVDESTLERFNRIREECQNDHTPPPTADGMLNSLMDEWEAGGPNDPRDPEELTGDEPTRAEIDAALERIESSVETVESRTGSIERSLEELQR